MTEIAFIACCKSKANTAVPIPASDLYTGTLFKAQLAYARQVLGLPDNGIFVLSARYGLVNITDPIASYEETLQGKKKREREEWGYKVRNQVIALFDELGQVHLMAGQLYRRPLLLPAISSFQHYFPHTQVIIPHPEHYGIGQQVQWYQRRHE